MKTLKTTNYLITETANIYNLTESPIKLMVATNKSFLAEENLWSGEEVREPAYYPCLPSQFLCNDCGTVNSQTEPEIGGNTGFSSTGQNEIFISTHLNADGSFGHHSQDACTENYQAFLSTVGSLRYQPYERIAGSYTHSHLAKVKYPMARTDYYGNITKRFNKQSICFPLTKFNTIDELHSSSLQLSSGIIYSLSRKNSFQKPLYFIVPTYFGLTYSTDPDIDYFFSLSDEVCTSKTVLDEGYFMYSTDVVGTFTDNYTTPDFNFISSTDINKIYTHIYDNKIIINFSKGYSGSKGNILQFNASNNEPGCIPPTTYSALFTLKANPNNQYEIQKIITSLPLDEYEIYVKVNFKNGESINKCQNIILNQNHSSYNSINVSIFGNILDYNNSIDNYELNIYKL